MGVIIENYQFSKYCLELRRNINSIAKNQFTASENNNYKKQYIIPYETQTFTNKNKHVKR